MISFMFINVLFWLGIIMAFVGGIIVIASFTIFKTKVMRTPLHESVEPGPNKKVNWGYALLLVGIVIYFLSYYLAIR